MDQSKHVEDEAPTATNSVFPDPSLIGHVLFYSNEQDLIRINLTDQHPSLLGYILFEVLGDLIAAGYNIIEEAPPDPVLCLTIQTFRDISVGRMEQASMPVFFGPDDEFAHGSLTQTLPHARRKAGRGR